jgi:hypothetical protein
MEFKTTIITMFFNIKKLKDSSEQTRPIEFYVDHGKHVLKLQYPMVIFCDEDTYEILKSARDSEVDPTIIPTEYIIKSINEYEYYTTSWNIINENRISLGKPEDKRNTVSYFLMGMFKPFAFNYVHQQNFFNTEYYAWIDLGCNHIVRKLVEYAPLMLDKPNKKVSVCYIHYRGHNELSNMKNFMKYGGPCGIASTAYTIESNYVSRFYTSMFSIFYEKLYNAVGHTDETVMTYCYDRYPEIFDIYNGDYYSVFTNYHQPIEDLQNIYMYFIINAIENGKNELAKTAARKIVDSNINLDSQLKDELLKIILVT